eukprot:7505595-Ditylum_brightwellii.AAC.1
MVEDWEFEGSMGSDVLHHVHVMHEQNSQIMLWSGVWRVGLWVADCGQICQNFLQWDGLVQQGGLAQCGGLAH